MDEEFEYAEEITFELVLMDSAPLPYTFEAFHQYLEKKGCEEKADFLAECILYQRIAAPFFPEPIAAAENTVQILENKQNIPFPTILEDMSQEAFQAEIQFVNDAWVALTEKFILPGAPFRVRLPTDLMEALQELIDAGFSHPDILAESYGIIAERLSENEFESFLIEQRTVAESLANSQTISEENLQKVESNNSSNAGSADVIHEKTQATKNVSKKTGLKSFAKGLLSSSREMLDGSLKHSETKSKKQPKAADSQLSLSNASLESSEVEPDIKRKSKSKTISKLIASTAKRSSTIMSRLPKLDRECSETSSASSKSRFPIPFIKTKSFRDSDTASINTSKSLSLTQADAKVVAAMMNLPLPDVTFSQVISGESLAPYTYHEYHLFLRKLKCDENLEFLVDCKLYQQAATVFFPTPIQPSDFLERLGPTLPDSITEDDMEFECEALWGWLTELAWKYLRPQAPREINVPSKIRRLLVGLIDKKVFHPGILNQCRASVEELLSQKDFFERFLYDRLETTLPESVMESQTVDPALKKKMSIMRASKTASQSLSSSMQLLRNGSVKRPSVSAASDTPSLKERFSVNANTEGIILEASDESGKIMTARQDSTVSGEIITDTSFNVLPSKSSEFDEDLASPVGKPTLQERLTKMQQVVYKKTVSKPTKTNEIEPISPVLEQPVEEAKVVERSRAEPPSSVGAKAANRISMLLGRKDDSATSEVPGTESNKKSASSRVKSFFGGRTTRQQE